MRRILFIAVWLAATAAATGLGFAAVSVVDGVAAPPEAVLAPVPTSPTGGRVSEFDVDDGALAVECAADDTISLLWARPSGGYTLSIVEAGPELVRVEFAEPGEVTVVDVVCIGGVAVPSEIELDEGVEDDSSPETTSTIDSRPTESSDGGSNGTMTTVDDPSTDDLDEPDESDDDEADEPDEPDDSEGDEEDEPDEADEPEGP